MNSELVDVIPGIDPMFETQITSADEMPSYRPVGDHLFVLVDQPLEFTPGGIVIPQWGVADDPTNERCPSTGTVLAIGPGAYTQKMVFVTLDDQLRPGARVLFSRFSGLPAKFDGREVRVLAESQILAVLEPDAAVAFNELTV